MRKGDHMTDAMFLNTNLNLIKHMTSCLDKSRGRGCSFGLVYRLVGNLLNQQYKPEDHLLSIRMHCILIGAKG